MKKSWVIILLVLCLSVVSSITLANGGIPSGINPDTSAWLGDSVSTQSSAQQQQPPLPQRGPFSPVQFEES